MIILQTAPEAVRLAAAKLRSVFRGSGIVVMMETHDSLARADAMLAGADVCVQAMPGSMELIAALLAIRRRIDHEREKSDTIAQGFHSPFNASLSGMAPVHANEWHLDKKGWELVSPHGTRMELTYSERAIMKHFLSRPHEPLTRESHGRTLNPANGKLARGLDVMISRLRRKAQSNGIWLPIRCVRGKGYEFAVTDTEQ